MRLPRPPRQPKRLLPQSLRSKTTLLSRIRPRTRRPSSRTKSPRLPRLPPLQRPVPELRLALPLPPLNLLPPTRFRCAVVCRALRAETPGRRKASRLPGSRLQVARPPVLLRQRLYPLLSRAQRTNLRLSPIPPKPPRLIRQPIPRLNRHPLLPRPPLLARVLPVPVWPQMLLAARAPESFPMFRCVADFPAPPGETPGRRKGSHLHTLRNLPQARLPFRLRPRRRPLRPRRPVPHLPRPAILPRMHNRRPRRSRVRRRPPLTDPVRRSPRVDAPESVVSVPVREPPVREPLPVQVLWQREPPRRRTSPPTEPRRSPLSASRWPSLRRRRRTSPLSANRWPSPPRRPTTRLPHAPRTSRLRRRHRLRRPHRPVRAALPRRSLHRRRNRS